MFKFFLSYVLLSLGLMLLLFKIKDFFLFFKEKKNLKAFLIVLSSLTVAAFAMTLIHEAL